MSDTEHTRQSPQNEPLGFSALLYEELHVLAERALRRERQNHTLQPTALAHEAWLRLEHQQNHGPHRAAFFALAACMIRRILVDHARARNRLKRRQDRELPLEDHIAVTESSRDLDVLALHEALEKMSAIDAQMGQIVELRFFGGLTLDEAAQYMGIPGIKARRTWAFARSWLRRELRRGDEDPE